jgi:DNA replication and repair protein RecF
LRRRRSRNPFSYPVHPAILLFFLFFHKVGMHVKSLYLRNFRNYAEAEVQFGAGVNLFIGDNAQGKTNLLEAIGLVATGRSFRTPHLQELIRFGESFFFLEGVISKDGFDHTVQISFDGTTKKLTLDGNNYGSLQHLLGLAPFVLLSPADSELIDGSPTVRRRFLNLHLAQASPLYMHHLSRYWRAMKQRNALLRTAKAEEIECWEIEMAESAMHLRGAREYFLSKIAEPLKKYSQKLSECKEEHTIHFQPATPPTSESYLQQLKKNRPREQHLGATQTGPHRDDFHLSINGQTSRGYSSEGQKKTSAFALRLSEWELFTSAQETPALFGMDDLALHLDPTRQSLFNQAVTNLGQVFVSSPQHNQLISNMFVVKNGTVQRCFR